MSKQINKSTKAVANKKKPGLSLELAVMNIQKMLDPNSEVTHDEKLKDRVGNIRQYDVVIRGQFGGRPVLGVIECKDHGRKKGPSAIEAFSKKTENLGANLRLMVSKKGFTKQALTLAKHENIGCLSLIPDNPKELGFSVGEMWYGVIRMWSNIKLAVYIESGELPRSGFKANTINWQGKPIINWFLKELFTTYSNETKEDRFVLEIRFKKPRNVEIEGNEYSLTGISCSADREYRKKKKWVYWSGDALFDWNSNQLTVPANVEIVGNWVETDLREWEDFNGDLPKPENYYSQGWVNAIMYSQQRWDTSKNEDVPDLKEL
jgi:hypothetical protein